MLPDEGQEPVVLFHNLVDKKGLLEHGLHYPVSEEGVSM